MSRSVNLNKPDFVANAREAWGEALPDWVAVLAEQCARTSATATAARIGYTTAVASAVIRANYRGDLGKVEQKVRGALMGEIVQCPVLDEITRDRCVVEQGKKHIGGSAVRAKLLRACRTCDMSLVVQRREAADAAA